MNSVEIIEAVWKKGKAVESRDASKYRKDQCGAWMAREEYGNRESRDGWEIDHITPPSQGGGDDLDNFRPLEWKNNVATSDGKLTCVVRANGNKNEDV